MPREVKAYLCEHKCGRRSVIKLKAMVEHEKRCAMNPARRACKTCEHNAAERYDEETGSGGGFDCLIDAFPADQREHQMAYDCPSWEPRAAAEIGMGEAAP